MYFIIIFEVFMYFEGTRDSQVYYTKEQDNFCEAHFHRSTEILLVITGEKRVEVNDKAYVLHAGDVLFCPPYAVHTFIPTDNSTQIVVTLLPEHCEHFEQFCQKQEPSTYIVHDNGMILQLVHALQNAENSFIQEGASAMLVGLFVQKTTFSPVRKKNALKIRQIADYITAHYAEQITLQSLAKAFGYSPTYFSAMFKKAFYMTLPQYVNAVRIQKSLSLLKTHNVSSIYFLCGFNNPQQFFLHFKKIHGCTPSKYLKRK